MYTLNCVITVNNDISHSIIYDDMIPYKFMLTWKWYGSTVLNHCCNLCKTFVDLSKKQCLFSKTNAKICC